MFSLHDVAEQLTLHVRTVRRYVRDGRLKAVRIGKQYRVSPQALQEFTGTTPATARVRHRRAEVSSVVQVDAISEQTADRISALLRGASSEPREDGSTLRIEIIYDTGRAALKVIVIGSLPTAAEIFRLLDIALER